MGRITGRYKKNFHKIERKNGRLPKNDLRYCGIGRRPLDQNYDFKVQ